MVADRNDPGYHGDVSQEVAVRSTGPLVAFLALGLFATPAFARDGVHFLSGSSCCGTIDAGINGAGAAVIFVGTGLAAGTLLYNGTRAIAGTRAWPPARIAGAVFGAAEIVAGLAMNDSGVDELVTLAPWFLGVGTISCLVAALSGGRGGEKAPSSTGYLMPRNDGVTIGFALVF